MHRILSAAIGLVFMTSVAAAAPVTLTYSYDAAGRLISVTYSNGASVAYTYDWGGNRLSHDHDKPAGGGGGGGNGGGGNGGGKPN